MKKKVIAIIMSMAIAVAFVPTFAFADVDQADQNQQQYEQLKTDAVAMAEQVSKLIQEFLSQVDFHAFDAQINDALGQVDNLSGIADALVNNPDNLEAALKPYEDQLAQLGALMEDLSKQAEGMMAAADEFYAQINQENPEAVAAVLEGVEAAKAQLDAAIAKAEAGELTADVAAAQIAEAQKMLNEALENLQAVAQDELVGQVDAFIAAATDFAKEVAEQQGITPEAIDSIIAQAEAIAAIAAEYAGLEPSEMLDKAVAAAEELYKANEDAITEAVMDAALDLYEQFADGAFDEYLAPLGLSGAQIAEVAENVIAAVLSDEPVAELQEKAAKLADVEAALEAAKAENEGLQQALQAANTELEKANAKVDSSAAAIAAFKANWLNAKKLQKKKVTAKKPKGKKKKAQVKWKKLKGVKVTGYQIAWKSGKKWKMKKVKGASKVKAFTKKIKVKKGKKKITVKVKVRAYYTMKYAGKSQTFYSKWSKVKKAKVKK